MELKFENQQEYKTAITYMRCQLCYTQYDSERTLRFYYLTELKKAEEICKSLNLSPTPIVV